MTTHPNIAAVNILLMLPLMETKKTFNKSKHKNSYAILVPRLLRLASTPRIASEVIPETLEAVV